MIIYFFRSDNAKYDLVMEAIHDCQRLRRFPLKLILRRKFPAANRDLDRDAPATGSNAVRLASMPTGNINSIASSGSSSATSRSGSSSGSDSYFWGGSTGILDLGLGLIDSIGQIGIGQLGQFDIPTAAKTPSQSTSTSTLVSTSALAAARQKQNRASNTTSSAGQSNEAAFQRPKLPGSQSYDISNEGLSLQVNVKEFSVIIYS